MDSLGLTPLIGVSTLETAIELLEEPNFAHYLSYL